MAIFNQPATPKKDVPPMPTSPSPMADTALKREPDPANEFTFGQSASPAPGAVRTAAASEAQGKESLIASDLTIEGKIQGAGHIRIAGKFKGDVHVEGDLTVEVGAKVNGGVRARKVIVAGELEGNVESAQRVELMQSGVIVGDVKAGQVVVASGARMRGQVEFGWDDSGKKNGKAEGGAGA